jgi:TonB-dependent receptor
VMGGARVEHAAINVSTFAAFDSSMGRTEAKLDNVDALPAVTATWRFIEDFQLRAGYSKTLNRPDFRELSPSYYYDLDTNLLLVGNADIKRALIQNYDLRMEWYYTPDEVFSVGGFYKSFKDPIEQTYGIGAERFYTVTNSDSAVSMGLELEGRKRFGFISKVLESLYLASNLSLITSTVDVTYSGDGLYHRPLQGQSPWVVNVQLGWDDSGEGGTGTSASLLFNTAGERIRFVGSPDPSVMLGDIYEQPIHRLDFVFSQELPHKLKLGGRARNLLNAEEKWTRDGHTLRSFKRGTEFQASLSWSY